MEKLISIFQGTWHYIPEEYNSVIVMRTHRNEGKSIPVTSRGDP
jgi:hypothetical protein